jgi:hypothetical protein
MSSENIRRYLNIILESAIAEKWNVEVKTPERLKGKWEGWSLTDLRKRKKQLMAKETRTADETREVKQINFAIRAKTGWSKAKQ